MDTDVGAADKREADVVLLIPTAESTTATAAAAAAATVVTKTSVNRPVNRELKPLIVKPDFLGHHQLELAKSATPGKPPRPPARTSPTYKRLKSRLAEQQPLSPFAAAAISAAGIPPASSRQGSPNAHGTSTTPKTPWQHPVDDDEEDEGEEEEDEFIGQQLHKSVVERRRKWRVRMMAEWAILVVAIGCLISSLTVRKLNGAVIWSLRIWRWCLLVAVICCGRLVTHWLVTLLVFLIERNFLLKTKVLYFVFGLKNGVKVCIWLGLVLLTWSLLFRHGVHRSHTAASELDYITRALASLLVASVLWLVKILLVKLLASSFHVSTFFDRIQESVFNQYLLQTLSGPPVMEMAENLGDAKSNAQVSFRVAGKGKGKGTQVIDVRELQQLKQEKVPARTMMTLINVIGSSGLSTISHAIENMEEEGGGEQRDQEITNELEAKAAASAIFKNVTERHNQGGTAPKYIDVEDLSRFLSRVEVKFVLPLFEGAAESGKIKKSALRNWVVQAFHDRKALALSLNDTKTAIKQLHKLASVVAIVVIVIVTLLLMGVASTKILLLLSSQLLLVVFMFGNTAKTVFEGIIFVFVMHPFDVGDRCVVDGVQLIVEEMNILTTTFLRYDNEKIQYPNSVLSTKPISNFYRSPDMNDYVEFSIDAFTPIESIEAFKSKIKEYIDRKSNHWHPNHSVVVRDIINVNKLNMVLIVRHTMNYQNMLEKNQRRSDLVLEMKKIFQVLSIKYQLLPQEVQLNYTSSAPFPISIRQNN